jgi:uncharacterized membrane protein
MENQTVTEGKTTAIIAYLYIPGIIIAFILNNSKKNSFASFHIRQALGLLLVLTMMNILEYYLGLGLVSWIVELALLVLWVIAFIGVIKGEEKTVPFLGDQFQEWFKNIG